jgi:hypothetical protein
MPGPDPVTAVTKSNTDLNMTWRKKVTRESVISALRELRGDDIRHEKTF